VVPALNLVERVADHFQVILVGSDDRAIQLKLNDGLRTTDRGNAGGMVGE
jgi:hypothetical protein